MNVAENIDQSTVDIESGPKTSGGNILVPHDRTTEQKVGLATQMATTSYVDDDVVVSTEQKHDAHIDQTILKVIQPQTSQEDIISFLKKPIRVSNGTFKITDTYSFLNSVSYPAHAFNVTQGALWKNKLNGFFGIRMDMKFRIVVNANKFQQGRYCLGWVPTGSMAPTTSNIKETYRNGMLMNTLVQRTTVKRVEIDLATDTAAELVIPFMSPYSFYPLNPMYDGTADYSLGFLNLYPYIPLSSPEGSTTAGYTIYVSFENVELYGAASPQAGLTIPDKEVSNKTLGPISSISNAVTKGFKEFEQIPLLGSYAKSIGWISDCITQTASIFGLSKPNPGSNAGRMQIQTMPTHSTVDGDTDARSLGLISKPGTVSVTGMGATEQDEMDFSFIKSKPAWFNTFTMTTAQVTDTQLVTWNNEPSTFRSDRAFQGAVASSFTPVAFLSANFKFWRGSIVYRFKIIKTGFHSGRIAVAFFPTDAASKTANEEYVNRMIIDVRECNEFEVVVPYISMKPWLAYGEKSGVITVRVVDALVAPTTVSPTISFAVEVYGGKDFEVAVPTLNDFTPVYIAPQSIVPGQMTDNLISATIGSTVVNSNPLVMTSTTIGEKITSVRSLLKRFTPIDRAGDNVGATCNSSGISIVPDVILCLDNSFTIVDRAFTSDLLGTWASCYTLMSGGIRVRDVIDLGLADTNGSRLHSTFTASLHTTDDIGSGFGIDDIFNIGSFVSLPRVMNQLEKDNSLTVEVPQYTNSLSRSVGDLIVLQGNQAVQPDYESYSAGGAVSNVAVKFCVPTAYTITPQANYKFHNLYRAGADDLQLYGFVSIPPMYLFSGVDYANAY